jgi:hypothetical protein
MNKSVIISSETIYSFLLKFYPESYRKEFAEEMLYVFSESLKDAYAQNGKQGVVSLWTRTIVDTGKSLVIQHLANQKGDGFMKNNNDIIMQNKIFLWIAVATALILSIPYLAMQLNWVKPDPTNPADQGVSWTLSDFIVMGVLIFGAGTLFVAIARITPRKYRLFVGLAVLAALLLTWVHLAVGIVDTWPFAGS